jgi:predicted DNA-binding protein (MmcQ/YjbR family)
MADALEKLREICLALPDVTEGEAWRHPVWRAGKAVFCGYEEVRDKWCVNVKLEEPHADLMRDDPRAVASQYLGG